MNKIMLSQIGSEPRVDSRLLADQLGNQHKNSMALIERYSEKFKEFGLLAFQTEARPVGQHGGGDVRFALLNEDQAFFLLALSRNTDRVVELKSDLIMAFREARYGHAYQTLEARKKEASSSGRRLAHWRYDKPGVYAHVAHLREQLKLPLDLEDLRP
jgi:phage regulator Rha-like protein